MKAAVDRRMMLGVLLVWLWVGGCQAGDRVKVLQNGVAPTKDYAGCQDTCISGEPYEENRNYGGSAELRAGGKRRILIRFDLSPIPQAQGIHKAVLRLADTGYPRKAAGKWPVRLHAYRLTRPWQDDANWLEHTRTNYKQKDAGDWQSPGGDIDLEADFGGQTKGLITADTTADGPWGHVHELDLTEIVRRWHSGQAPNHGLALEAPPKSPGCTVAGSEWHVPAYRPMLIVTHGPKGAEAVADAPLEPAAEKVELDGISATPDAGEAAGDYAAVRVGQNANCALRGASTDAYVKEAAATYPGTWGWMNMCRVGGRAGDFSRALLYFDLKQIPKTASIRQAKLVLSLTPWTNRQAGSYRYGAYLLKLPGEPGWQADEVTSSHCREGRAWPKGGLLAASGPKPLAIGQAALKRSSPDSAGTMEFDLTGAVRAWAAGKIPNCGLVLDNRLEGGAYDFYSSRSFKPELRPYLEIMLSPAIGKQPAPAEAKPALPPGDYWVQPMRQVHKLFKGKPGTLAQYGDSITVSMAFLAYRFGKNAPKDVTPPRPQLALENTPPQVRAELEVVDRFSDRELWWRWKGAEWGNTGMMMSDWLFRNVDAWQKKMNPETAVIMFGTNDRGRICPPEYTEYMAASVRRMMQDGTVPMLTSIPPPAPDGYRLATLSIAAGLKVPVIDYNAEITRRRGDDWSGKKDPPGLISEDGVHPSHPGKYHFDFSEEALNRNGYLLRDYLTLRKYYEVITKVLHPEAKQPPAAPRAGP